MKGYYMVENMERESFHSIIEYLMRKDFLSILIGIMVEIINKEEELLKPDENKELSDMLFLLLNFKPKTDDIQHSYDDILGRLGQEPLRDALYKKMYSKELKELYPIITKLPIAYESTEIRIANMHFSGAIGLFDGVHDYEEERSQTARWFHFFDYKQIRAASSVEELTAIDAPETKLALVYILTGHYLDWYARLLTTAYTKAGFGARIENTRNPQIRLQYIIEGIHTHEEFKAFLPATTKVVPTSVKKKILEGYCDKKVINGVVKLLNEIGEAYSIGYKTCSKKRFAQIAWMVKEYCLVIKTNKYKTCKDLLTKYYGVQPTQYKVKDCSDLLKTVKGKTIKMKIENFCIENKDYCRK